MPVGRGGIQMTRSFGDFYRKIAAHITGKPEIFVIEINPRFNQFCVEIVRMECRIHIMIMKLEI